MNERTTPPPPTTPRRRGALGRGLRLTLGVGLMAALLYYADPATVGAALASASPVWLLAAAATVIADRAANAHRWLLLLRAIDSGRHVSVGAAMRVFFVSGFLGSFLPGSVGGDAVRTLSLSRLSVPPADALASVFVDRMLGIASVLLMASAGLALVHDLFSTQTIVLLLLPVAGALAVFLLLLFDQRLLPAIAAYLAADRFPSLHRMIDRALAAIRQYGNRRGTLLVVLGLSVGVQVLRTLQAWTLGQALGLDVGLLWYFAFLPVIILVMLLPTSVAGLGTGALAFQLLFGTVGVSPADAFALAVLFSATALIGALAGGVLFVLERGRSSGDVGRSIPS